MKLENFKSELFNNQIEKLELVVGGKTACRRTAIYCTYADSDGCLHTIIDSYQSDNC